MKKWLRGVATSLIGLGGIFGSLLLSEGLVRIIAPQIFPRPALWEHDPFLGWRHIPGAQVEWRDREFTIHVAINSKGLRDREVEYEKPADTFRILTFGDSFIEGWGVELDGVVAKQLETKLNTGGKDSHYEVLNFGVAGYGTDQELLFFREEGIRYKPDLVVLFFYINDMWNNLSKKSIGTERGLKPYFTLSNGHLILQGVPVPDPPERPTHAHLSATTFLSRYSHLYVLLRRDVGELMGRVQTPPLAAKFYAGLYSTAYFPEAERGWALTGALIRAFDDAVRRAGAKMMVVFTPSHLLTDDRAWAARVKAFHLSTEHYDLNLPSRRIRGVCEASGIPFVDLRPSFRAHTSAGKRLYYPINEHWNAAGHTLAADILYTFIRQHQLASPVTLR